MNFLGKLKSFVSGFKKIDDEFFEELEEILIMADVGVSVSEKICEELKIVAKKQRIQNCEDLKDALKNIIKTILEDNNDLKLDSAPAIILMVGVNGVGKTTTIGKLANLFKEQGKKIVIGAADTFRAAAVDQLKIWADRAGVQVVAQKEGSDPAAVVFDTISSAKAKGADIIICDTAGRLHNKKDLMQELAKINRVIERELPESSKEVLIVLDATTGQNALNQAREFKNFTGVTGAVLTKLDGTAKGGCIIAVKETLGVPVKFIGTGESISDIEKFDVKKFVNELL